MGWLAREGVEDGNDHPYELGEQVFNLYVPNSSPVCRRVARLSDLRPSSLAVDKILPGDWCSLETYRHAKIVLQQVWLLLISAMPNLAVSSLAKSRDLR
ncbi:hypothetical protein RRG08_008017 [Elysia crispata]|uniref:Uncharacterized protein n=1 Tax=Elysia crispata TaxID=231223 RepID=A0AAE0YRA5_9GAST|nr:hypothetical protein RRG08_008017 [Elysia crispata]